MKMGSSMDVFPWWFFQCDSVAWLKHSSFLSLRFRGNVRGSSHTKAEKTEKMDVYLPEIRTYPKWCPKIFWSRKDMSAKASCFWWIFLWSPFFCSLNFGGVDGVIICFFSLMDSMGLNLCCERFIGVHRLQPVGFGSHFRWLGRVFQPIFICFFKNPKANHRETGCMKTYLKTLSEIMGSLSTNKPTDAYSSLASSLVNAGFLVAINRMVCVLFFWLQKFCFLGLGWTSGNDSVPTHPTCRSQWGVPKSRCGVFVDFLRWKMCGCFFFHLEKKR